MVSGAFTWVHVLPRFALTPSCSLFVAASAEFGSNRCPSHWAWRACACAPPYSLLAINLVNVGVSTCGATLPLGTALPLSLRWHLTLAMYWLRTSIQYRCGSALPVVGAGLAALYMYGAVRGWLAVAPA